MKTGVDNETFWYKIGSRFEEAGGTPPPRIPRSSPLPPRDSRQLSIKSISSLSGATVFLN